MSHFTEMKCKALTKNEGDLIAALKATFGEDAVEVYDEAKKLSGYDTAANKKAHIIVRKDAVAKAGRGYAYNDLGYQRMEDGTYSMHYDPTDIAESARDKIMQDYAERVATRKLKAQGYKVVRKVEADGKVVLSASPMGKTY